MQLRRRLARPSVSGPFADLIQRHQRLRVRGAALFNARVTILSAGARTTVRVRACVCVFVCVPVLCVLRVRVLCSGIFVSLSF